MKIDELAAGLPNGLHDALLKSFSVDIVRRTAEFELDIFVGDCDATESRERELLRAARISLTGVRFFSVDPPGAGASQSFAGSAMIDLCGADEAVVPRSVVGSDVFAARFFVSPWNAFIHFAALDATLTWTDLA